MGCDATTLEQREADNRWGKATEAGENFRRGEDCSFPLVAHELVNDAILSLYGWSHDLTATPSAPN
jgi:hypothetical protein